jgi:predicted alpha-1,2-mannosidase
MNRCTIFLWVVACVGLITGCTEKAPSLSQYVNPFIGTGGHGHTFPGATLPFGMVQLSPDTRLEGWDGCSGYHYSDSIVYGFSHTHLSGTGVGDYCDILFMPVTGEPHLNNGYRQGVDKGYSSRFDKRSEKASPGSYQVRLSDYGIQVSLTTSKRVGFHQYDFGKAEAGHVIIDLKHRDPLLDAELNQVSETEIAGYRISKSWAEDQRVFFFARFSSAIDYNKTDSSGLVMALSFNNPGELLVKVGISPVSIANAKENLEAEIPGWNFNKIRKQAARAWNEQLNKVQVEGGTTNDKTIFYTALYHTMIAPNLFTDVNGQYRAMDGKIYQAADNTMVYSVYSLWDTFRATHPLYTLIEQDRTNAFINNFLDHYDKGGLLPVWELGGNETFCMIGYNAVPVIADAYAKGIRDYDAKLALEAMKNSANQDHLGLEAYKKKGYIGAGDEPESASKTLEYAYDDWCIYQMAELMDQGQENETFSQRGQYYKNLFNPATGFMQARMHGGWFSPFDPAEVNFNYTEANAWQYTFFVPQDISGMIELYGGPEGFEKQLDGLFTAPQNLKGRHQVDITGLIGQYAHGNEPSHHMAYLYNYIGKPWKTQKRVRQIMRELYHNQSDGLSGNEDCGQMSAWYVLSAMGFYSVTPGLPYYTMGSPIFDKVTLNLENGNRFVIEAPDNSNDNIYIQSASLNGINHSKSFIEHRDIMAGGNMVLTMGEEPSIDWGAEKEDLPVSKIDGSSIIPVPFFETSSKTFTDTLLVKMGVLGKGVTLFFTTDGSEPGPASKKYQAPITINQTTTFQCKAIDEKGNESGIMEQTYFKIDGNRKIELRAQYANQYAAGGDKALIDHLRGNNNYRTGYWQGYQGQELEVVVDLGSIKSVSSLSMGFLQDVKSWIWYPKQVTFAVSKDGKTFIPAGTATNTFPDDREGSFTQDFTVGYKGHARYVKVTAPNYGPCPEWHLGAGGSTWLFADEVTVQ